MPIGIPIKFPGGFYMAELRNWLIFKHYLYLVPTSLILIFGLTYLFRNKNWKKCILCFVVAFIIGALCHHFFYVFVYHLKPGLTWHIFSTSLLKEAISWSFYTMLNFLILRSVLGILRLCRAKRAIRIIVLLSVCCLYAMFYPFIKAYESYLFGPLLYSILNRIPELRY